MNTSKLTRKAQTTIPQPIRAALNLHEGEQLRYQVDGQRVILTEAETRQGLDDPFRTFRGVAMVPAAVARVPAAELPQLRRGHAHHGLYHRGRIKQPQPDFEFDQRVAW